MRSGCEPAPHTPFGQHFHESERRTPIRRVPVCRTVSLRADSEIGAPGSWSQRAFLGTLRRSMNRIVRCSPVTTPEGMLSDFLPTQLPARRGCGSLISADAK